MMENPQRKRNNRLVLTKTQVNVVLSCIFSLMVVFPVQAALDQNPEKSTSLTDGENTMGVASGESLEELLKTYFTYSRENRSDPFASFIKKEAPKEVRTGYEPEEILSGMQLFEPSQLSLVSIVFSEEKTFAMVQDSVGQGYIVEKGTKIGRRGVVEEIIPNVVVIKQWSMTFAGEKRYKNIEMVLRKEGE